MPSGMSEKLIHLGQLEAVVYNAVGQVGLAIQDAYPLGRDATELRIAHSILKGYLERVQNDADAERAKGAAE